MLAGVGDAVDGGRAVLGALTALLAACSQAAGGAAAAAQAGVAQALTPPLLAVQDAAHTALAPVAAPAAPAVHPAAVALIVRWEVTSPARYTQRYQGVICPGGASGPTIGIGDDLGHQPPAEIRRRWGWHPAVERLVTASGQVGPERCAAWRARHRDVRVTYPQAYQVFAEHALPQYAGLTRRVYRGVERLGPRPEGALVSNVYNRGPSMAGDRAREKRVIRDTCVPQGDPYCVAQQLRAMCRLWAGTPNGPGLCARRHDEAALATSEGAS